MSGDVEYIIEGGYIKLPKVEERITCSSCGNLIALRNGLSFLVLTNVVLVNHPELVMRCGKCSTYNYFKDGKKSIAV